MSLRDTLNKIENLVVGATHIPLTEKAIINDNSLIRYVEELRQELPEVINNAEKVMRNKDKILEDATREADRMKDEATALSQHLLKEETIYREAEKEASNIVYQAKEHAAQLVQDAEANASTLQEQARDKSFKMVSDAEEYAKKLRTDTDNYARGVFDQLLSHVNEAYQKVNGIEEGLEQSVRVLENARMNLEENIQQNESPTEKE